MTHVICAHNCSLTMLIKIGRTEVNETAVAASLTCPRKHGTGIARYVSSWSVQTIVRCKHNYIMINTETLGG
jgi:hypothetical protein